MSRLCNRGHFRPTAASGRSAAVAERNAKLERPLTQRAGGSLHQLAHLCDGRLALGVSAQVLVVHLAPRDALGLLLGLLCHVILPAVGPASYSKWPERKTPVLCGWGK